MNAKMNVMRSAIEPNDRTYTRLRARAAERGMRGFSALVEEALALLLQQGDEDGLAPVLAEVEGVWTEQDVEEWTQACEEAWAMWPTAPALDSDVPIAYLCASYVALEAAVAQDDSDRPPALGPWTWLRHLPPADLPEFVDEIRDGLLASCREHSIDSATMVLDEWRETAEALSDSAR